MKIDIYSPEINNTTQMWINALSNEQSIFFKGHRSEKEIKKIFPKFRKNNSLKLIKLIKVEAMKLLTDKERFGVYPCRKYWAQILHCEKSGISKMLHRLQELDIIKLFPVALTTNTRTCRVKILILPGNLQVQLSQLQVQLSLKSSMIPNISKGFFKVTNYQDLQVIKLMKYLDTSYLNPSVKFLSSPEISVHGGDETQFSMKGKPVEKFIRYQLKRKPIETKVTFDDYELTPNHFMSHIKSQALLEKHLTKLVNADVSPMTDETQRVIEYWNSKHNKQFAGIQKRINSRTFLDAQIAVTYAIDQHMVSLPKILKAIDVMDTLTKYSFYLRNPKYKVSLTHQFLSGNIIAKFGESWLDICQYPEQEAIAKACGKASKFSLTFNDRLRPLFVKHFYPDSEKLGYTTFDSNYSAFVNFNDRMVDIHQNCFLHNIKMENFIDRYFQYIVDMSENWADGIPKVSFIINDKLIGEYIRWQRHQQGWDRFGTDKPKEPQKNESDD